MLSAPTNDQINTALDVLLWLHEDIDGGAERDEISHVRYLLTCELEDRGVQ